MADIVDLDEHRPHISGPVVCTRCRHKWEAVRPVGTDLLECPLCGASRGASLDTMLHKPHLILGAECCGQRDGDGVCAAPACLYGDALTLVQCLRDASHLEYPALRAEVERLRAALHKAQRASEMAASMIRDKRRTQAYGRVAEMVERIACHFDRIAKGARTALNTQEQT